MCGAGCTKGNEENMYASTRLNTSCNSRSTAECAFKWKQGESPSCQILATQMTSTVAY